MSHAHLCFRVTDRPQHNRLTLDEEGANLPRDRGPWEREEVDGIIVIADPPTIRYPRRCSATASMSLTNEASVGPHLKRSRDPNQLAKMIVELPSANSASPIRNSGVK